MQVAASLCSVRFLARARGAANDRTSWTVPHEVRLQAVIVANVPEQIAHGVVRPEHGRTETSGKRLQLPQIDRRFPKPEIEIDGCHRRTLQRVAALPISTTSKCSSVQMPRDFCQKRPGFTDELYLAFLSARRRRNPQ
jgi:hypothetical protein